MSSTNLQMALIHVILLFLLISANDFLLTEFHPFVYYFFVVMNSFYFIITSFNLFKELDAEAKK